MSRFIALIVLVVVGAACLATAEWYDDLYVSDKLLPKDVYGILMSHRSNPEAQKYAKMWQTNICTWEPFTSLYNGPIGSKRDQPASLKNYIEYCEEYRKKACEKWVEDAAKSLLPTSKYADVQKSLTILAINGDERAKEILLLKELGKDCDKLDELQVLPYFPFHGKDESLMVAEHQKDILERSRHDCRQVQTVIEEFRRKLDILKKELTPQSLKELQNFRERAYASYLEGVDPKDIGELKTRAQNQRCSSKSLFRNCLLRRSRKSQAPSSCEDVKPILGTHPDQLYLLRLESVPGRMRLNEGELEWIQTLFLCVEYTHKTDESDIPAARRRRVLVMPPPMTSAMLPEESIQIEHH